MRNKLFIFGNHFRGETTISIGIGSRNSARRVFLTEDEAVKLGYRLISLGKGGETNLVEEFPLSAS